MAVLVLRRCSNSLAVHLEDARGVEHGGSYSENPSVYSEQRKKPGAEVVSSLVGRCSCSYLPSAQSRQPRPNSMTARPYATTMIVPFRQLIKIGRRPLANILPPHRDASTSPPLTVRSTRPESNPAILSPSSSLNISSPLPLLLPLRLPVASNTACLRGITSRMTKSLMRSRNPSVCLFTVSSGRY